MNMNKNYLFHLTGCIVFLLVGARMQNAKATYPAPGVVEAHWKKNPKVFQETFETLFPQAGKLHLWSEEFPDGFEAQNENSFAVDTDSDWLPFHTLDDLEKLPCDVDLKKIIKVVGSTEFLKKVLPEEVVKSIFVHAVNGKDSKTEIKFRPHLEKNFFNMFGKGELRMWIRQFLGGSEVLDCHFSFAFEKKNGLTVLTDYDGYYAIITQDGRRRWTEVEFLKKTEQLSDFPCEAVTEAKERFPFVYKGLRDALKSSRKFKICSDAERAKKDVMSSNSELVYTEPLLDVLITEDFLKGIFGEEFWNILEHYNVEGFYDSGLSVEFNVSPYGKGLKVSYSLYNTYRGNRTEDVVSFRGEAKKWEWLDFNYINFVFFYDPEKDEISNVSLQDKLVLNYKHTSKVPNGFIAVDNEDSAPRCYSFKTLLEKSGINP